MKNKPLTLLILDGWGLREAADDNAISLADTPNWNRLLQNRSCAQLQTSGEAVGLPAGQMGNSEVGHMNIGAGRIVYQDLVRITKAFENHDLEKNHDLQQSIQKCAQTGNTVHIIGLLSPGGVHSHEEHIFKLLALVEKLGADQLAMHAILDGRDTPPRSAGDSLESLTKHLAELENAHLATVGGRFYGMDRDQRWDRIARAWQAIVNANSDYDYTSGTTALQAAYARDESDEFVQPCCINGGIPVVDGDVVLFANFRADRARQLTAAFCQPDFTHIDSARPQLAAMITLTRYQAELPCMVLFPPETHDELLGQTIAAAGLQQLRIAETEKYAHVTFFFNGGIEQPSPGEQRELIASPDVKTYDLQPEMSAPQLTKRLVEHIRSGQFDVIICNVANPDMVGHCGNIPAAVKAVEAVDTLLGEIMQATEQSTGELLITADHGNIEQMHDQQSGQAHTAHTTNPVPLIYFGPTSVQLDNGALCDIAPTMLELLQLNQPQAMTGRSLIINA